MKLNVERKILIISLILFLSSCKVVKYTDFIYDFKMEKLPRLSVNVDIGSFQNYYLRNIDSAFYDMYYVEIPDTNMFLNIDSVLNLNLIKRVDDALTLINDNFKYNMFYNDTNIHGFVNVRVLDFNSRSKYKILYVPHILTLCLLGYFNVPYFYYESKIVLEYEFYNKNHTLIAKYSTEGTYSLPISIYGYSGNAFKYISGEEPGIRKSNIECVKVALTQINLKISNDIQTFNNELK